MLRYATLILTLFSVFHASAQFYDNGQDPSFVNWKLLETAHYKLIFADNLTSLAQEYASHLEKAHELCKYTLAANPKKLSVILHNYTSITNGEVGWAPSRMNLYLVGGQDNFHQPWDEHLTIHEVRHNFQLTKLNQGLTKGLSFLFGEIAVGAVLGLHLPLWFIEGDAVAFETGTTHAGRGRDPDFYKSLQAQVQNFGAYSYPKAIFGSYKDYIPGRYELGYYLVAKARTVYNNGHLWDSVMTTVARNPIHPNPFSKGIKQNTALSERKLYFSLLNHLIDSSRNNQSTSKENYCNYYNPHMLTNGIIALKTDYKNIPRFVMIARDGRESVLFYPGSMQHYTFDANDSLIVWNEYQPTRYSHYNFNNISVYNLNTKKKQNVTLKTRTFSTVIDPEAKRLASVEVSEQIQWKITLRDIETGQLLDEYPFANQIVQLDWSPDAKFLVFIEITSEGKSLGILNLDNKQIRWIIKNKHFEISHPKIYKDFLLVKGSYNGVSNFFTYDLKSQEWRVISDVSYKVEEGNVTDDFLYFSNYTANGFRLDSLAVNAKLSMGKPQAYNDALSKKLAMQEEIFASDTTNHKVYPVSNYSRLKHLFRFHSWSPIAMRVNQETVGIGASVMAQNDLSTSFLEMGYHYRHDLGGYHEYYLSYDYKGFYPIIRLRNSFYTKSFQDYDNNSVLRKRNFNINRSLLNVQLPFITSEGAFTKTMYISLGTIVDYWFYDKNEYFPKASLFTNSYSAGWYVANLRKRSVQDLNPRWGQTLDIYVEKAPFDSLLNYNFAAQTNLYFPGLAWTHSLSLYAGYQRMKVANLAYYNQLLYPRGEIVPDFDELISTRVNYVFPLAYPDLNFWEILYVKRIRSNLFYDFAKYSYEAKSYVVNSVGLDLSSDFHALRFIAPIHAGVRYAYNFNDYGSYFGFLFSLNFDALY